MQFAAVGHRFFSLRGGQADDQPFEDQPRRHGAFALQVQVGLQEPAIELAPALPAQQTELPLGLLQDERADARLFQCGPQR